MDDVGRKGIPLLHVVRNTEVENSNHKSNDINK